jgi:aminoglycoside phosphotransferase (APT) family kinase protein
MPLGMFRRSGSSNPPERGRSTHVVDVVIADGGELRQRLLEQGLDTAEIVFKYHWPRYAPPAEASIRSLVKSEHLRPQFERIVEMHAIVPSSIPLPVGQVRNPDGDFVGYILEYVDGVTFGDLLQSGMLDEARRQHDRVRETVMKLHAKNVFHGDLNPWNVIVADDGRTVLLDPLPFSKPELALQDELCLDDLLRQV